MQAGPLKTFFLHRWGVYRWPRAKALPLALLHVLACTALLTACAGTPGTSTLLPAEGSTTHANRLAAWWRQFNDPQLNTLVSQALQANSSLRSAQAALQQSRALSDVQAAKLLPNLSAGGSAQRSQNEDNGSSSFRLGLDASWEPDVFGRQRATLNATRADAQAAQATLADAQVSVTAEVARVYVQLRGLQAQLGIALGNLGNQNETLQITRWRAQAGLITALEVEQARAASEQTSALIPLLQTSIATSVHSLSVLTGQAPEALQAELAVPQPLPAPPQALAASFPADSLRQRPDVRAAEHRITAALARLSAAQAAAYPSLSISGALGLNALTLGALTQGGSLVASLLGSISIPLLNGGAITAQISAQEAVLEQARAAYQATTLNALKDVADALVTLSGDIERLARLQRAADAAVNADQMAQQRYASGLIDFQTVLQTQRTVLSTQDSVASTQTAVSTDHVRLFKALGGGWN